MILLLISDGMCLIAFRFNYWEFASDDAKLLL